MFSPRKAKLEPMTKEQEAATDALILKLLNIPGASELARTDFARFIKINDDVADKHFEPYPAISKQLDSIEAHVNQGDELLHNLARAIEELHRLWEHQYDLFCDKFNDVCDRELDLVKKYMKERKEKQLATLPTINYEGSAVDLETVTVSMVAHKASLKNPLSTQIENYHQVSQKTILNMAKAVRVCKNQDEALRKRLLLQDEAYKSHKGHLMAFQEAIKINIAKREEEEKTPSTTRSSSVSEKSTVSQVPQSLFNRQPSPPKTPAASSEKPASCCLVM